MGATVGIDLGTTNSCVAIVEGGEGRVLTNERGDGVTPSVVAFTDTGQVLVGEKARRQAASNPEYTIVAAKRLIGRSYSSETARRAMASLPYYCKEGPEGDIRLVIRGQELSLPEISAHILRYLKEYAERSLGQSISRAVITVPAYFNDHQRQATRDSGALAGLEVVRIINEPTAAALAAGLAQRDLTVAVYDLGGGTFDLSVLDIQRGVFEVLASGGDSFLGGVDFDDRIVDFLATRFLQQEGVDLRQDPRALQRLRDAAEKAKIDLSTRDSTQIYLPFIHKTGERTLHCSDTLERSRLEDLCRDLVERSLVICSDVIDQAALERSEIDLVLLVGGMSRMPMVQNSVRDFFGRAPSTEVDPDKAVAVGAAMQSAIIEGDAPTAVLLDVTSQDLGIQVLGGLHEVIIPRNTTVPTSEHKIFHTVRDFQTEVRIIVIQGESKRADQNEILGEFTLTGLREARRGEVRIEVTFGINADGIVSVGARDMDTGQQQSIVVNAHTGLSEAEMASMRARADMNLPSSELAESFERLRREAEDLLYSIDRMIGELRANMDSREASSHPVLSTTLQAVGRVRLAIDTRDATALETDLAGLRRSYDLLIDMNAQWQTAVIPAPLT